MSVAGPQMGVGRGQETKYAPRACAVVGPLRGKPALSRLVMNTIRDSYLAVFMPLF